MTTSDVHRVKLYGRRAECQAMADLVARTRRADGGTVFIRGNEGTGKTALLDHAVGIAGDLRVIRASGVRAERRVAYAGLQQLCAPLADGLDDLPALHRGALEVVLGEQAGPAPNRLLLGLAVLGLLSAAGRDASVLCAVDDAHWLDRPSLEALVFAARRLPAGSLSIIVTARPSGTEPSGLPEITIGGLEDGDARDLLAAALHSPLDEAVREVIVAESRGNPRILLSLSRTLSLTRLAGGFGLPDAAQGGVSESLRRKVRGLPAASRLLLLVAAADPTGDPALLRRASELLGIPADATSAALESGLLDLGRRVVFRHPAVRSAAYLSAGPGDRQAAHRALAGSTVGETDDDRRAWHQALGAASPDERIAGELEQAADHAAERGGLAARAAFLERAALLTPDPCRRSERALAAAGLADRIGASDATMKLLDVVSSHCESSAEDRARADAVRAVTQARFRVGDAPQRLLEAAHRLQHLDSGHGRAAYREAVMTATTAAGLAAVGNTPREVALDIRRADRMSPSPVTVVLLEGVAACLAGDYGSGLMSVRAALNGFHGGLPASEQLQWLPLACIAALVSWDETALELLSTRRVALARELGALADLPGALSTLASSLLLAGDAAAAETLALEAFAVADDLGVRPLRWGGAGVAAVRGRGCVAIGGIAGIGKAFEDATVRGEGLAVATMAWAEAVRYNASGNYHAAFDSAERAVEAAGSPALAGWAMAEQIEAASRTGRQASVTQAVHDLSEITSAAASHWALGVRSRSLAVMSDGAEAEIHYDHAVASLTRSHARLDLARAHLLYGEWLRRENRRIDARVHLRQAQELLESMGANAFVDRARRELLATDQNSRKRVPEARSELTAQELQIAVRARDGHTNAAIGNELFLSRRTVEWHLRKVFMKLGITARGELMAHLVDAAGKTDDDNQMNSVST